MTKTFENIKIYYVHGYQSSPDGDKGTLFKEKLNAIPIKYRECEPEKLVISECLDEIYNKIKNDENVVLIGSSLGGLLASVVALNYPNVKSLILLNPATIPPNTNLNLLGDIPRRIAEEMVNNKIFEEKIQSDIFIIRGTDDDVVKECWVLEFAKFQEATVIFLKDDHRFSNNILKLPNIISRLLDY
jgi:predicted esterase YcpF (UPF0227 family)